MKKIHAFYHLEPFLYAFTVSDKQNISILHNKIQPIGSEIITIAHGIVLTICNDGITAAIYDVYEHGSRFKRFCVVTIIS